MRLIILALCIAAACTGCLKTFTTVTVNADGSAMIRDSVYLTEQVRQDGLIPADTLAMFKRKLDTLAGVQASQLGPAVRVRRIDIVNEQAPTGWVITYDVSSIDGLRMGRSRSMKMISSEIMQSGDSGERASENEEEPLSFSYRPGVVTINVPQSAPDPSATTPPSTQSAEELQLALSMMESFFHEMRMVMKVEFAGTITKTNASFRSGQSITLLDIDFDKLLHVWKKKPALFRSMQGAQPGDPAALQRAMKKLPKGTLMIETKPTVTVAF